MLEAVTVGRPHVIHADRGDGFQTWIDLGGADGEAATAADTDDTDTLSIDDRASTEIVHGCTKVLGVDIRRDGLARCALAFAPEGQIQRQCDKSLLGHFCRVQVRTLFLHCAHWMTDNDRGVLRLRIETL